MQDNPVETQGKPELRSHLAAPSVSCACSHISRAVERCLAEVGSAASTALTAAPRRRVPSLLPLPGDFLVCQLKAGAEPPLCDLQQDRRVPPRQP